MIINQLENGVTEYVTDKAIVRIHPGKLSTEELRAVLEAAAIDFFKAIQRQEHKTGKVILPPSKTHQDKE